MLTSGAVLAMLSLGHAGLQWDYKSIKVYVQATGGTSGRVKGSHNTQIFSLQSRDQ